MPQPKALKKKKKKKKEEESDEERQRFDSDWSESPLKKMQKKI